MCRLWEIIGESLELFATLFHRSLGEKIAKAKDEQLVPKNDEDQYVSYRFTNRIYEDDPDEPRNTFGVPLRTGVIVDEPGVTGTVTGLTAEQFVAEYPRWIEPFRDYSGKKFEICLEPLF